MLCSLAEGSTVVFGGKNCGVANTVYADNRKLSMAPVVACRLPAADLAAGLYWPVEARAVDLNKLHSFTVRLCMQVCKQECQQESVTTCPQQEPVCEPSPQRLTSTVLVYVTATLHISAAAVYEYAVVDVT